MIPENYSFFGTINPLVLIYFIFFVLSIAMGIWVLAKNKDTHCSKVFLALSISMAFVHLGEIFFSWSIFKPDAFMSHAISSIGFFSWWPLSIHLLLIVKQKIIGPKWIVFLVFCYLFCIISSISVFTGYSASADYIRSGVTWIDVPHWSLLGIGYLILLPIWIGLLLYIIISIYRKARVSKNVILMKQFHFIGGVGFPMIALGLWFNIISPGLGIPFPAIGHIFLGFWILALGVSITKYRFLVPTMEFASKEIIAIAGEIIVVTDLQYSILDFNEAFSIRLGYTRNEELSLVSIVENSSSPIFDQMVKGIVDDVEVCIKRKNGGIMNAKQRGSYLYDNDIAIGIVFVLSDITELKRKNEELEEKVIDRTKQLADAKNEAERRLGITQIYTRRSLVNIIQAGGDPTTFPPTNQKVNVLFSDIRNFTQISEHLSPLATVEFLNVYFESMNDCVINHDGEIDKLIGDCIMAIFESSEAALDCAASMRQKLIEINAKYNLPIRLNNGIGIHYGEVTVGNIGSQYKMDWTVIGDVVNSASRIETLTKIYGLPIIISEDFLINLKHHQDIRFIDKVLVKGKKTPLRIFEYFGHENEIYKQLKIENQTTLDKAYDFYTDGDFVSAIEIYKKLISYYGPHKYIVNRSADPVIDFYLERCIKLQELTSKGLLHNWNGIYEFLEK